MVDKNTEPKEQKTSAPQAKKKSFQALGIIEIYGFTAAIEAADAMVKSADVRVLGTEKIGSGLVNVMIEGDVAAVKAAVESGQNAASRVGEIVSVHVIPRPHEDMVKTFPED